MGSIWRQNMLNGLPYNLKKSRGKVFNFFDKIIDLQTQHFHSSTHPIIALSLCSTSFTHPAFYPTLPTPSETKEKKKKLAPFLSTSSAAASCFLPPFFFPSVPWLWLSSRATAFMAVKVLIFCQNQVLLDGHWLSGRQGSPPCPIINLIGSPSMVRLRLISSKPFRFGLHSKSMSPWAIWSYRRREPQLRLCVLPLVSSLAVIVTNPWRRPPHFTSCMRHRSFTSNFH